MSWSMRWSMVDSLQRRELVSRLEGTAASAYSGKCNGYCRKAIERLRIAALPQGANDVIGKWVLVHKPMHCAA